MSAPGITVHVIDQDVLAALLLESLLKGEGYQVRLYPDAEAFLEGQRPQEPGVLIVDPRLPGMSGLELQARLASENISLPIIFISAGGTVSEAVQAMKAGAHDYLEKPCEPQKLLAIVGQAAAAHLNLLKAENDRAEIRKRLNLLTRRERQVMELVGAGYINRQIATHLGLSTKTVELHRSRVMRKMQAKTVASLMRQILLLERPDTLLSFEPSPAGLLSVQTTMDSRSIQYHCIGGTPEFCRVITVNTPSSWVHPMAENAFNK